MPNWKGKSRGNVLGYKIFIFVLKISGIYFAYLLLAFVAFYFYLFSFEDKKHIGWYFRNIQKFGYWKTQIYTYLNFYAKGVSIIDKIAFLSNDKIKFSFNFDGEANLRKLSQENTGALIIGAHIGNWEVAGQLMERIDTKVNIVMKLNEVESIQKVTEETMVLKNMNIINISDDFSYLIEIKKALDNNEFVILHGDRFIDSSNLVEVNFMNRKADFSISPFILALKFRKPIIFAFSMKETWSDYHFYASEPIYNHKRTDPKLIKEKATDILSIYLRHLEEMIKKHPEQWYNYYRFWK